MAMTLSTLRALTRQLVGDPQGSTYSQEMYQDAINFACKEYAKKTGVTYVETAVAMDTYTGLCTIPTAYMRINRVLVADALAFGVYKVDSNPRLSISIGTSGSGTTPEDAARYLSWGNCILFPSATATLMVKKEVIQIRRSDGTVVSSVQSDGVFSVGIANPDFTVSNAERCYGIVTLGYAWSGGQYADITLIGVCNGVSGEIKVRYVEPLE